MPRRSADHPLGGAWAERSGLVCIRQNSDRLRTSSGVGFGQFKRLTGFFDKVLPGGDGLPNRVPRALFLTSFLMVLA